MYLKSFGRGIPAEQKIKEIEEGVIPDRTRLLENRDEIINEIRRLTIAQANY
jgi:hypothetical protein